MNKKKNSGDYLTHKQNLIADPDRSKHMECGLPAVFFVGSISVDRRLMRLTMNCVHISVFSI
jgi:hypothetical protein